MISVVLVDDQELARAGLRTILRRPYGFDVVGEAADGRAALAEVARVRPDAVVMDIRMPRMDGVEATRALLAADPAARVLVLTTFGEDGVLAAALRAGASGFCLKDAPAEDIQRAVRAVAGVTAGWIPPSAGGSCGVTVRTR
ncbi:response regulator transcription factor [Nonomuraea thailandensis]